MAVTPQTNATLYEIAEFLRLHDDFVISGHVNPDGDCIGSQLALAHALESLGKTVTCVLAKPDSLPHELAFLPGAASMVAACDFDGPCNVFVGVDVPSFERLGQDASAIRNRSAHSITIDHHAADERMCDMVHVDPDSASASILVWNVIKLLCPEAPYESALCAYTGLVTDTGCFRFQNSDARAFATASELITQGVDAAMVATRIYQEKTLASLKLESLAVDRMELVSNGSAVVSWVTMTDFQALSACKSDAESLVDVLRSMSGVKVVCMLREQDDCVRGSLRAKDDTDVASLARKYDGGGHRAAAGFTLYMPIDQAVALMRDELANLV